MSVHYHRERNGKSRKRDVHKSNRRCSHYGKLSRFFRRPTIWRPADRILPPQPTIPAKPLCFQKSSSKLIGHSDSMRWTAILRATMRASSGGLLWIGFSPIFRRNKGQSLTAADRSHFSLRWTAPSSFQSRQTANARGQALRPNQAPLRRRDWRRKRPNG